MPVGGFTMAAVVSATCVSQTTWQILTATTVTQLGKPTPSRVRFPFAATAALFFFGFRFLDPILFE